MSAAKATNKIKQFSVDEEEDPHLTSCGLASWRPKWAQIFANPLVFLVNLCIVNICQLMNSSISIGTMSTLEKRFSYNTKISSVIMVSDLFLIALASPIVGYYALRFNRARMIAVSEIILGFSCIISATPYFIYGPATHLFAANDHLNSSITSTSTTTSTSFNTCSSSNEINCSTDSSNTIWPAVIILLFGRFFNGVGFTVYYTVAMPFIDDNVPKKNSPFYISIMHGINLLGRLVGYFFSAYFLSLNENPWSNTILDRTDPRFIGAWWLGFLVTGILVITTSLPLFFYPKEFKTANLKAKDIEKTLSKSGNSFISSLRRFASNPLLILYFLGNEFRYIGINGFYAFMAKYFESQYRQSSSQASIIAGSTGFAPVSLGLLIGGFYISYFQPKAKLLFTLVFLAELVSVFTIGSGLFLGCEPIQLAGVQQDNGFELRSTCNEPCNCTTRSFSPVCAPDSRTTYFSPCHAGCSSFNQSTQAFEQCSCFTNQATPGYCTADLSCDKMSTYLVLLTIGTLISATAKTGNSLITFRSVDPVDKSFTNGVLSSLICLLAILPCELSYGFLVDWTCLVWESKCGQRGNCWLYDQNKFRTVFLGVSTAFMAVGSFFDLVIIFYADQMKSLYGEGDDEHEVAESAKQKRAVN